MKVPKEFFKYNNEVYNEKIYRLYRWMIGEKAPPYKLVLVPTNRCNLKCFCCPNAYARSVGRFKEEEELTDKQWVSIVKEGLKLGVKEWYILGGGEPMMRKELVLEIVKMIKKSDFFNICEIITNGALWEKRDVKKMVQLKLDRLLISIDSYDTIHDYLRGADKTFEKATQTLKYFKEYKEKYDSDKPVIQMNSIINNKTYNKLRGIIDYASSLGVSELALHPMREYEETKNLMAHLKLNDNQINEVNSNLLWLKDYAQKKGLNLNIDMVHETYKNNFCCETQNMPKLDNQTAEQEKTHKTHDTESEQSRTVPNHLKTRCFEPFYSIFIDPKGNANFCCAAGDGDSKNNITINGLENMWYGQFFTNIRNLILNNGLTEKCGACGLLDMTSELRNDLKKYVDHIKTFRGFESK